MRILVIEDNPKIAAVIAKGLGEQGYNVDLCHTGIEGEELGASEDYQAIVLDLMLPDRDGVVVCRNLRRRGVATPILMLTALGKTEQKVTGLDAGADDYLTKPFEFAELVARIRALFRRSSSSGSSRLEHADLVLDLSKRKATRGQERIRLSAREFALLEYLMRNPDRVLSRTAIIESVWDIRYEPTSNVVDVYISSLRRKIDKSFETPLIHTVIGSGYRFGVDHEPVGEAL